MLWSTVKRGQAILSTINLLQEELEQGQGGLQGRGQQTLGDSL